MLAEIPSALLTEWMAFSQLEPFGFMTDLYGHALVASMIANVNRKKGKKPFKPSDFMPVERDPDVERKPGDFVGDLKRYLKSSGNSKAKRGNNKRPARKART